MTYAHHDSLRFAAQESWRVTSGEFVRLVRNPGNGYRAGRGGMTIATREELARRIVDSIHEVYGEDYRISALGQVYAFLSRLNVPQRVAWLEILNETGAFQGLICQPAITDAVAGRANAMNDDNTRLYFRILARAYQSENLDAVRTVTGVPDVSLLSTLRDEATALVLQAIWDGSGRVLSNPKVRTALELAGKQSDDRQIGLINALLEHGVVAADDALVEFVALIR